LTDAHINAHVAAFNKAVQDGDWERYLDRFTEEEVLEFAGPPVGPFVGRVAIAQAYADTPPDATIEVIAPPSMHGDAIVVRYRWGTGETGSMRMASADGLIEHHLVTFD
jgi:steroid delta-isomerase